MAHSQRKAIQVVYEQMSRRESMEKGNSLKQEAIRGVKCIEPTTSVDHYDGVSN
jgi:hypothetical protein